MKKLLNFIFILVFLCLHNLSYAQKKKAETSDKQAKSILDELKEEYESYRTLDTDFTLTIEPAEGKKDIQKGKMYQNGKKYKIKTESQEIICDGSATWTYLKKRNEVQVNNAEAGDSDAITSPSDLLRMYESGSFIFVLVGEGSEAGKVLQYVEGKPTDKNAEFAKIRIAVTKKNSQIYFIKTFNKDGSRYTLTLNKFVANKKIADNTFVFDPTKYPNVRVEDLR